MKPNKAETAVHSCHCQGDWLCACVRSWPGHGLCFVASLHIIVLWIYLCLKSQMIALSDPLPHALPEDEMSPTPATTSVEWSWCLKGCFCSHLGSKGHVRAAFELQHCPTAMPCWWSLTRPKQLSMAATARVIGCAHAWGLGQAMGCVLWLSFTLLFYGSN